MSDQQQQSKADLIEERRQNLPLPDDPPAEPDWQSADASKVNVGSGGISGDVSAGKGSEAGLRGPATDATTGGVDSGVGRAGYGTAEDVQK